VTKFQFGEEMQRDACKHEKMHSKGLGEVCDQQRSHQGHILISQLLQRITKLAEYQRPWGLIVLKSVEVDFGTKEPVHIDSEIVTGEEDLKEILDTLEQVAQEL
jgi:hypothetical protein